MNWSNINHNRKIVLINCDWCGIVPSISILKKHFFCCCWFLRRLCLLLRCMAWKIVRYITQISNVYMLLYYTLINGNSRWRGKKAQNKQTTPSTAHTQLGNRFIRSAFGFWLIRDVCAQKGDRPMLNMLLHSIHRFACYIRGALVWVYSPIVLLFAIKSGRNWKRTARTLSAIKRNEKEIVQTNGICWLFVLTDVVWFSYICWKKGFTYAASLHIE